MEDIHSFTVYMKHKSREEGNRQRWDFQRKVRFVKEVRISKRINTLQSKNSIVFPSQIPCIVLLIYFTSNVFLKVVKKIFCLTISIILSKLSTAFSCKKNLTTNQDIRKVWDSWKRITGIFVSYEQFTLKLFTREK